MKTILSSKMSARHNDFPMIFTMIKHVRRKSRKNNMKLSNGPDPGYYDKSKFTALCPSKQRTININKIRLVRGGPSAWSEKCSYF